MWMLVLKHKCNSLKLCFSSLLHLSNLEKKIIMKLNTTLLYDPTDSIISCIHRCNYFLSTKAIYFKKTRPSVPGLVHYSSTDAWTEHHSNHIDTATQFLASMWEQHCRSSERLNTHLEDEPYTVVADLCVEARLCNKDVFTDPWGRGGACRNGKNVITLWSRWTIRHKGSNTINYQHLHDLESGSLRDGFIISW